MKTETFQALSDYLDRQAEINGVDARQAHSGSPFAISNDFAAGTPSVQQKLIDKQQEDSSFLAAINIQPVEEISGEVLGLGVGGTLAGRTDTSANDRVGQDPSSVDVEGYTCKQTNSDTFIKYSKLDAWAKFPDFQTRVSNQITRRQALDRIMIGWNGTSAAAATNRNTNPLLQDVNIGWLQKLRVWNSGARYLSEGVKEDNKIIIGSSAATSDYRNLNALVVDLIHNLLPSWARGDQDLVVVLGEDLMHETFFPLINKDHEPSELLAGDLVLSAKRIGGKKCVTVPYFPANGLAVTRLDNLSIYEQEGKRRRAIKDNPARDRIDTFESSNDAYVIEDFDFSLFAEHIQFGPTV